MIVIKSILPKQEGNVGTVEELIRYFADRMPGQVLEVSIDEDTHWFLTVTRNQMMKSFDVQFAESIDEDNELSHPLMLRWVYGNDCGDSCFIDKAGREFHGNIIDPTTVNEQIAWYFMRDMKKTTMAWARESRRGDPQ